MRCADARFWVLIEASLQTFRDMSCYELLSRNCGFDGYYVQFWLSKCQGCNCKNRFRREGLF